MTVGSVVTRRVRSARSRAVSVLATRNAAPSAPSARRAEYQAFERCRQACRGTEHCSALAPGEVTAIGHTAQLQPPEKRERAGAAGARAPSEREGEGATFKDLKWCAPVSNAFCA